MEKEEDPSKTSSTYCNVCNLDLQSLKSLAQHIEGRKHVKKSGGSYRKHLSYLSEEDFWFNLHDGVYCNIVVCSGAGISTSCGIKDFRSSGGLFVEVKERFGERFPFLLRNPERVFSRSFATQYPHVWSEEIEPWKNSWSSSMIAPSLTHHFIDWLHQQG